ncbi:sugar ABC transporter permease [Oceanotoga sp. DSM 15011]|jgi:multiple sugar transport system permease protein|uniref:Carbohydrate ABC transporter membrane protein 1 (CUT1 family) n=1 Tax=Oceanotoga teriensis TaxID=515440 RepID=A0AA45C4R0_9BACT|nr:MULTISPECIES: sugar ABC transporter permease [Oceanotoga]MDN5343547.1 trehalose/maltose transport system permease protein [Oceanotoga sp.]MDO7977860.1 sugar ABC transporter permease [Oceanotoga teriensis]PWJ86811.1 carbohydrate ABC transporter membrane protein 1 (CUT1 family) [Oceanotoga teriensis]UYO99667.1 sugar ABC transporter permease [Oceanotoga sp. DSM 15011]
MNNYNKKDMKLAFWLIIPALIAIGITAFIPLIQTFYDSFFKWSLRPGFEREFLGFKNYIDLFQDSRFLASLWNTIYFSFFSVLFEFLIGLGVALILNAKFKFRGFMRAAMLIPWAVPTVISSQMWRWMFNDQYGVISNLFYTLGILEQGTPILADPKLALNAIVAVDVWKTTPFVALLLLAGLQLIPGELYEASRIDGATKWKQFTSITLPILKPTIAVTLIFRTLDALRVFDIVYIMTPGLQQTETMSVYNRSLLMDNIFSPRGLFGYGSALSVIIFLIIGVFTLIYIKTMKLKID